MKFSPGLALAAFTAAAFSTGSVAGQNASHVLNGRTCAEADKKGPLQAFQRLEKEGLYGLLPEEYSNIPADCLPNDSTSLFGAWYRVVIPGSAGLELDVISDTYAGGNNVHAISVMEGSCGALSCIAVANSEPDDGGEQVAETKWTLTTNTPYYIFFSVLNVPGTTQFVPNIELQLASPEQECKHHRSFDLTTDGFGDGGVGTCTPCSSSTREEDGTTTTTWTTTCSDACQHCYENVNNPLQTTEGPFCFKESRKWTKMIVDEIDMGDETTVCYTFADNTTICDSGSKHGACPLQVNGVACSSCEEDHNQTGCAYPYEQYGVFKADCSNLGDGSGVVDKCANTGFDSSPAMSFYGIYTDIVLANNAPQTPDIPVVQGECVFGNEAPPELLPQTLPPTLTPDPPVSLTLGSRTAREPIAMHQSKQYVVSVAGMTGIIRCESEAKTGDVDLMLAVDRPALDPEFLDCISRGHSSGERCSVVISGENSEVNVVLYGYTDVTDARLRCSMEGLSDARTLEAGVGVRSSRFSLREKDLRLYKLRPPTDTARVICTTETRVGDLDLFIRVGDMPVEGKNDCEGTAESGDEYCEISNPELAQSPDVYILMQAYTNVTNGRLSCREILSNMTQPTADNAQTLRMGSRASRFDLLENENRLFYLSVPQGTRRAWCDLHPRRGNGNVDLYLRVGEVPVLSTDNSDGEYDCKSINPEGNDYCDYRWEGGSSSQDTRVYALARGFEESSDVEITCNAIVPVTKDDAIRIGSSGRRFDMREEEEIAFYYDVEQHTGEVKCSTKAKSGDLDMFMTRVDFPNKNGNNDCTSTHNGNREECKQVYGNQGSDHERIYILLFAHTEVNNGEIRCSSEVSKAYLEQQVQRSAWNFWN